MIQKTIIATLLALLSGAPILRAQTMDTTSVDTLISITDSLIGEVIREIKKEINDEASNIKIDIKDEMDEIEIEIIERDTYRMVKRKRKPQSHHRRNPTILGIQHPNNQ